MKRLTVFLLSFALLLSFTACAAEENPQTEATTEPAASTQEQAGVQPASDAKILIAYFTAAENSDVDAVSSASVVTINGEVRAASRRLRK